MIRVRTDRQLGFSRNSNAYIFDNGEMVEVLTNAPRFESGGLVLEEGTENLLVETELPETIELQPGTYTISIGEADDSLMITGDVEYTLTANTHYTFTIGEVSTITLVETEMYFMNPGYFSQQAKESE